MCLESISMTIESAGDSEMSVNSSISVMTSLCLSEVRPSISSGLSTRVSTVLSSGDLMMTSSRINKTEVFLAPSVLPSKIRELSERTRNQRET